jgi:cell division protein FtsB
MVPGSGRRWTARDAHGAVFDRLPDVGPGVDADDQPAPRPAPGRPSLDGLPVAGLTRRRAAFVLAGVVSAWIILAFARQVGDASAATAREAQLRVENQQIEATVVALQSELELIQRQAYIEQQARGYGLGARRERPFVLAPDAGPLPPDAPGSAALRLGASAPARSPLESWLSLLFGPASGG